jgi:hypothetical protein
LVALASAFAALIPTSQYLYASIVFAGSLKASELALYR